MEFISINDNINENILCKTLRQIIRDNINIDKNYNLNDYLECSLEFLLLELFDNYMDFDINQVNFIKYDNKIIGVFIYYYYDNIVRINQLLLLNNYYTKEMINMIITNNEFKNKKVKISLNYYIENKDKLNLILENELGLKISPNNYKQTILYNPVKVYEHFNI